ncbi:hypothetical protein ANN_10387 [Periplaneta americana]|uniref:Uncharacterized protein n=1 Tax=Periplaneta americana TaxID=6978 RepID=A0ABQ8TQH1_PERAM|nr:hypothetical protein ANN_10387 [Periplaneta americana]
MFCRRKRIYQNFVLKKEEYVLQKKEERISGRHAEERRISPQKKEEYLRRRKKNTAEKNTSRRIPAQKMPCRNASQKKEEYPQKKEEYLRRRREEERISSQKKEEYLQRRILPQKKLSEKNISAEEYLPNAEANASRRANVEFSIVTNKAVRRTAESTGVPPGRQAAVPQVVHGRISPQKKEEYLRRRKKNIRRRKKNILQKKEAEERRISTAEERRISPQKEFCIILTKLKNCRVNWCTTWTSGCRAPGGPQKNISTEERRISPQKKEDLRRRKKNISAEERRSPQKKEEYLCKRISPQKSTCSKFRKNSNRRKLVVQPGHQLAVSHGQKRINCLLNVVQSALHEPRAVAVTVTGGIWITARMTVESQKNLYNLDISLPCPIWSVQELDCLLNAVQSALHGPRALAVTQLEFASQHIRLEKLSSPGLDLVQPYQGTECYMHAIHMRAAKCIEMEGETSASKLRIGANGRLCEDGNELLNSLKAIKECSANVIILDRVRGVVSICEDDRMDTGLQY